MAEVQTDAGGLPGAATVESGEALFKDAGQVLGRNADAVVGNHQPVRAI